MADISDFIPASKWADLDYYHCDSPECKLCVTLDKYRARMAEEQAGYGKVHPGSDSDESSGSESEDENHGHTSLKERCCYCCNRMRKHADDAKKVYMVTVQPQGVKKKKKPKRYKKRAQMKKPSKKKNNAPKEKCRCCCCRPRLKFKESENSTLYKLSRKEKQIQRKLPGKKLLRGLDRVEIRKVGMWNKSALCWATVKTKATGGRCFYIPIISSVYRCISSCVGLAVCGSLTKFGLLHPMPPDLYLIDKIWGPEEENRMHDPSMAENEVLRRRALRIVCVENRTNFQRIMGQRPYDLDFYVGKQLLYKMRKQYYRINDTLEEEERGALMFDETQVLAGNCCERIFSTHSDLVLMNSKGDVVARIPQKRTRALTRCVDQWIGAVTNAVCCTSGETPVLAEGCHSSVGFPKADYNRKQQLMLLKPHPCLCACSKCSDCPSACTACCVPMLCQKQKELWPAEGGIGDQMDIRSQGCWPWFQRNCFPCLRVCCDYYHCFNNCHCAAIHFKRSPALAHVEATALKDAKATKIQQKDCVDVTFPTNFTEIQKLGAIAALLADVA